jgi:DNA polymerase-3 subunit gamma/tau
VAPAAPAASVAPAAAVAEAEQPAAPVEAPEALETPDLDSEAAGDWTDSVPDQEGDYGSEPLTDADAGMEDVGADLAGLGAAAAPVAAERPDPARMTAQDWPALAASLPVSGAARALAVNSEWLSGDEHAVRLRVAIHSLAESSSQDRLRTVLSEHFGRVLRLDVDYGSTGEDTAYAVDQAERGRRLAAAEQAVETDPLVQALTRQFAARVVPGSVRPPAV